LGILDFAIDESGIVIKSIIKDSIAYEVCGFRVGTVITKINGKPVTVISREEMLAPLFYLAIDNYTILENGIEHTFPSPFKENLHEISASEKRSLKFSVKIRRPDPKYEFLRSNAGLKSDVSVWFKSMLHAPVPSQVQVP
jgi:hypothetical protein